MCGVFALFLRRPLTESDLSLGRAGTLALRHRGPDHGGEWFDREKGVYLGHRRLSIIDLHPASNQPMARDGLVLSYNGEIYNYRSLREDLIARGSAFASKGDTEVLLRGWQRDGGKYLSSIDGMFAFALWDGQGGWLATDRFGEKQLFVAETPDGVYVSSELTPLVELLKPPSDMSVDTVIPFMALGYIPAPATAYPSIKRLKPASIIRVVGGQIVTRETYWRPSVPGMGKGPVEPLSEGDLDQLAEELTVSIQGRLETDVPTCLFLSGGVDSALIAAIAARELRRELPCVTVSFPQGKIHDEGPFAKAIADHLKLPHRIVESHDDPRDVNAAALFDLFGQPNENVTTMSAYQMAAAARGDGFRVGLMGMGGDELFYGYQKHDFFYRNRWLFGVPETVRLALAALMKPLAPYHGKFRTYRNVFGVANHERYLAVKNLPAIAALQALPGFTQWAKVYFHNEDIALERTVPYFDIQDTMVNSQLPASDLGGMRAGHEIRTPYLNYRLQELVAGMDMRAFLAFGQKSVLRRLLKRYLPDELVDQPKRGFKFPVDRFLRQFGNDSPIVSALPGAATAEAWRHRDETGWQRLALRVALLSSFEAWQPTSGQETDITLGD
jgi:asparagine synthase (glutamine-hydrolysing)